MEKFGNFILFSNLLLTDDELLITRGGNSAGTAGVKCGGNCGGTCGVTCGDGCGIMCGTNCWGDGCYVHSPS